MLFPLLTLGPRFGNVPWAALPLGVMILGALHLNHAAGVAGPRYQLTDRIGRETSFPYIGGHLYLFCDNGKGGQGDVYNTTAGWQNKALMNKTDFELEPDMIGTQYGCIQVLEAFKIGPLHCDPFTLIPKVTKCSEKQWCLIGKDGQARCEDKIEKACFLGGPLDLKEKFITSLPSLKAVCPKEKTTVTHEFGLCQARSEGMKISGVSDKDAGCGFLKGLTVNELKFEHEETLVISKTQKKWTLKYEGTGEITCWIMDNTGKSVVGNTTFKLETTVQPKLNKVDLPSKLKISCIKNNPDYTNMIEVFAIIFDPDTSKYNVKISKKLKAEHLELTCTCNIPDGFVCGLTWEEPEISNELQKFPGDLDVKKLYRKNHAKPIVYTCYMQVLAFNYPNTFKLKRVPLETKYLQANVTIDTTDFDIHNGGTDSNGNTDGSGKGGPGTKDNGSNGDKSKEKPPEKSGKNNTATIVAVVLVLVVIIAAAIFAIFIVMKRRKAARLPVKDEPEQLNPDKPKLENTKITEKEEPALPEQEQPKQKKDMTFIDSLEHSTTKVSGIFLGIFYAQMGSIFKAAGGSKDRVYGVLRDMPDFSKIADHWDILKSQKPSEKAISLATCRFSDILLEYLSAVFKEFFDKLGSKSPVAKNQVTGPEMLHMSIVTDIFNVPTYIASMAPKSSEMPLFLATIIKKGVTAIVALLARDEKDDSHPEGGRFFDYFSLAVGEAKIYGDCKICCLTVVDGVDIITRQFEILQNGTKTIITHIRYLSWIDFGVADIGHILSLKNAIARLQTASPGLTLVHCSAGVGRTGTLLCSLLCIQYYDFRAEPVDVCKICCKVRSERLHAIQSPAQLAQVYWVCGAYKEKLLRWFAPAEQTRRNDIEPKGVNQAGSPTAKQSKGLSPSSAKKVAGSPSAKQSKGLSPSSAKKVATSKLSRASKSSN